MYTTGLNSVDLCFVVDVTGSMGGFIQQAQKHLLDALNELTKLTQVDLHCGLVEYRDHPPQDNSFVTRVSALTGDFKQVESYIKKLSPQGGGDGPEAVYDGVVAACTQIKWRPTSYRLVVLVGDAPPHGYALPASDEPQPRRQHQQRPVRMAGDAWPNGCPCGSTIRSVTAEAEAKMITIHGLLMGGCVYARAAFSELATFTGGTCATVQGSVIEVIINQLKQEFEGLAFDQQVLDVVIQSPLALIGEISEQLQAPRQRVARSVARLGKRGFLYQFALNIS